MSQTNHNQQLAHSLWGITVTSDVTLKHADETHTHTHTRKPVLLLHMQKKDRPTTEKTPLPYPSPLWLNSVAIRDQVEMFCLMKLLTFSFTRIIELF